jgi:hypothetical protein
MLTVGAHSKVGGLKEVCALAAFILAVDCLLLCAYLAAILGVMVEVSEGFDPLFLFDFALRSNFAFGIHAAVCDNSSFFSAGPSPSMDSNDRLPIMRTRLLNSSFSRSS